MDYMDSIKTELSGIYGEEVLKDLSEIIRLYGMYDGAGQNWSIGQPLDYIPTKKRTNFIKKLIKEEARFLFGKTPEFTFISKSGQDVSGVEAFVNRALEENLFSEKIVKAARDCFIGKRVAVKLSYAEDEEMPIKINFVPSLGFVFSPYDDDIDKLQSIIFFHGLNDKSMKGEQRIWKQKYWIENGRCFLDEGVYNGYGQLIEKRFNKLDTGLTFIPAKVIVNDGLTGDLKGESDVAEIVELQNVYNRISSDDIDALKFNMFPQTVAVNASEDSLNRISICPSALIDLQPEYTTGDAIPQLYKLESSFSYDTRAENVLNRLKSDMHELLSIPNLSHNELRSFVASGKTLKALYWQLTTRCEEKFSAWRPALVWLAKSILKMGQLHNLFEFDIPKDLSIDAINIYPLLQDELDEKKSDIEAVTQGAMSKKAYIKKWNKDYNDLMAEKEITEIKKDYIDLASETAEENLEVKEEVE